VLEQMANTMAFRIGGIESLEKAKKAQTINTSELNSGIQISGQIIEIIADHSGKLPIYIRTQGPTQLAYSDVQLNGHDKTYHGSGFGTAVGHLKEFDQLCPSLLTDKNLEQIKIQIGNVSILNFVSGIQVKGNLKSILRKDGKIILMSFDNCKVTFGDRILFEPAWGTYDLAIGSSVTSVFAGPADREAYGETDDFVAARVPQYVYSETEKLLHQQYLELRKIRDSKKVQESVVEKLIQIHDQNFPSDWLFRIEALELLTFSQSKSILIPKLKNQLKMIETELPEKAEVIADGIRLIEIGYQ